jgi:hypothetical protein
MASGCTIRDTKRAIGTHLALSAIVTLGASLRIYEIGAEGLWIDEAFSVWLARQPWGEMVRWVASVDQHPPLYYTLLHGWIRVFGDGEANLRALSALLGTLTLPVGYLLGRRLVDRKVGLFSALILATSPFHVRFAQEARMYTLLTLTGALALYAFIRLLDSNDGALACARVEGEGVSVQPDGMGVDVPSECRSRIRLSTGLGERAGGARKHPERGQVGARARLSTSKRGALAWVGYVTFTATMLWTHNAAILFPITLNLFVLGCCLIQSRSCSAARLPTFSLARWRRWLLAQMAVFLLWLPWLPAFISQAIGVYGRFWLPEPTLGTVLGVISAFLCDFRVLSLPATVALDVILVAVVFLGLTRGCQRPVFGALLATLFVIPLLTEWVVSLWRPILYARTLIWISMPLLLMLAAGLRALELRLSSRSCFVVALVILLAVNGLALYSYYDGVEKEAWDEAAALVARHAQPDDVLLFNDSWGQIPFDYYFRRLYNGSVVEHGLPVDLFDRGVLEPRMTEDDVPRAQALIRGRERVWLVYSHDWYTDPEGLVPQALEGTLSLLDRWDFYGLGVLLYGQGGGVQP